MCLVLITTFSLPVQAKHMYLEKEYQEQWCSKQPDCVVEYILPDKTRIDCLTPTHAIEFDFGSKWAEAIGQSLYYGLITGRKAGIVLILEDKINGQKYLQRLQTVSKRYGIDVWIMSPQSMPFK